MTDDLPETHITDSGLWIPPELREFEKQVVFRTPGKTTQHFGTRPLEPYYPLINRDSFGDEDSFHSVQNPKLAPNRVSIKPQGEDAVTFRVTGLGDDE